MLEALPERTMYGNREDWDDWDDSLLFLFFVGGFPA